MNWRIRFGTEAGSIQLVDCVFILYFISQILIVVLDKAFGMLGVSDSSVLFLPFLLGLILLTLILTDLNRWKDWLLLYICVLLIFLLSYLLTPGLGEWYANENWGLGFRVLRIDRGIYAYLMLKLVGDPKRILRDLKIAGIVWGMYLLVQTFHRIVAGYFIVTLNDGVTQSTSPDNMAYGYNCAFVALIFFAQYRSEKKKAWLIAGLVFSLLSVLYGSRGCLIVLGTYFILTAFLALRKERTLKKVVLTLIIIAAFVLVFIFYDSILLLLSSAAERFGVRSENITSLLNNSIGEANGRDRIWGAVAEQIGNTFPFGSGAFGDRLAAGEIFAWGYSHNIFLEMTASFGLIGILLLGLLAVGSGKIILTIENEEYLNIFLIFFCCSMKLVISDSFWFSPFFWGALAIGTMAVKHNKKLFVIRKAG